MGILYYGDSGTPIEIEDRALAHVKVVIATKLRRGESFTLSWHSEGEARGRSTIWLEPSISLRFTFDEPDPPALNHQWLEQLAAAASSTHGIQLTPDQVKPRDLAGATGDAAADSG